MVMENGVRDPMQPSRSAQPTVQGRRPASSPANSVSLCLATYRRPVQLKLLLEDLTRQTRMPDELIVIDNDAAGSARQIVEERVAQGAPFRVHYEIQPVKNISITRNKTVEGASGDWLAFIDDDERAPPEWLERLLEAADRFSADGVLGPVIPLVPPTAPAWIRRGRFYDYYRVPTGTVVPAPKMRFGNVLVRGAYVRAVPGPFDPELGLTGGEDGDLLARVVQLGAKIVWCDEANVDEPVESGRLSLPWLMRRALSGGQDFARHTLRGRYGSVSAGIRAIFFLKAASQTVAAAVLTIAFLPLGRHRAAHWLTKVSANIGKMTVFFGWRYREYG
jgi:succinoglycan biosynthesis protein ExoM